MVAILYYSSGIKETKAVGSIPEGLVSFPLLAKDPGSFTLAQSLINAPTFGLC